MPDTFHLLVIRAGGLPWALPMDAVEITFDLSAHRVRRVGASDVVVYRGEAIEYVDLAERLGAWGGDEVRSSAVVVWAAGTRVALGVDELVGQLVLERQDLPSLAAGSFSTGVTLMGEEVVPILEPGAVTGAWSVGDGAALGFTEMQQSALREVANIGSSHAATALSQLLGKNVEIGYAEALLTVLAEAIDRIGAPMSRSALVDTPVAGDGGTVLLVFPDEAAEQLCQLLGTTLDDPMGRSALQEIGNILATSYLNALVEMTGMELEPEPPQVEVDLLGKLLSASAAGNGSPHDPTVLMRSQLTVEASDAKFSFLFVPRIGSLETLLDRLGVGSTVAVA